MSAYDWIKALVSASLDIFSFSFVEKIAMSVIAGITGFIGEIFLQIPYLGVIAFFGVPYGVLLQQNKANLKRREKVSIVKAVIWPLIFVGFGLLLFINGS